MGPLPDFADGYIESSSTLENGQVARIETFVWIVTTFIIILATAPLRALATPEASACGYLASQIDKAQPGPLFCPAIRPWNRGLSMAPHTSMTMRWPSSRWSVAVSETKQVGWARRSSGPSIMTGPGMMDGSETLTPRVWWRMAPPNFRVGGTIIGTNGWRIDIRWEAMLVTWHGPCWRCCRLMM